VNLPADEDEETMIRDAIKRNRPVGREAWVEQTAVAGGPGAVPATPRPPGRMAQTHGSEWERHLTVLGTFISFQLKKNLIGHKSRTGATSSTFNQTINNMARIA
jgi:hypothetical protein